ncbi:MAG: cobaltochelatase subunit CobT, partial [Stellaceae bacterium]
MAEAETPVEIFKRATAAAVRAIAEREDINIVYGAELPAVGGTRVRLPLPGRDLQQEEAAQLRGAADAAALRLRYHDDAIHAKRRPPSDQARQLFEAIEQTRVEAIGAQRMAGVAANLAAHLEERCRRQGLRHVTERDDAMLPEAVRLLAREALTGAPPPPSAKRMIAEWRPFLEGKVGRDFIELARHVKDQDAYAKV